MPRIALIPGDGIGKEVVPEAERVLRSAAGAEDLELEPLGWDLGADRYLRDGVAITEEELHSLAEEHDAILLGALGDPRVPGNEHAERHGRRVASLVAGKTTRDLGGALTTEEVGSWIAARLVEQPAPVATAS